MAAEDVGVRRLVEVLGADLFDHDGDRVAREQHRSEHRLLGVEVVRRYPRASRCRPSERRPSSRRRRERSATGCRTVITI